ncbi:MAG: SNF2-related protein [Bacteroidia bacterium]
MAKNLFDYDFGKSWPDQDKFPLNEETQGSHVRDVLKKDIQNSENLLIITGFTSLSNLVETFGTTDYPLLKKTRIVIGFDVDERVSKKLVHYSLQSEIKEYWLKQGVSIKLCGPIINIIEKIKRKEIFFKVKKRLHAKIYIGDEYAILGSSNFSKSGLIYQREANIRVNKNLDAKEEYQYNSLKQIANNYFDLSDHYNTEIIDLLTKLLKDATWEEALARAIAEILENKWMKDFSILYQAIVSKELWPSQRIGIARAMSVIQDQGNVLLADPTGSGKTKFATTLAFTLFHWLGENGYKDRSNALIIAPKQVLENWEYEQGHFNILNKIESMGKLSNSKGKSVEKLQKEIEKIDILLIDEAHNYLNWKSQRSLRIKPKRSAHIILSTATPINKRPDDLLRLIELLDIDNLSDADLDNYIELRKQKNKTIDTAHINKLKSYINQFIVRRTKKELNKMIEREPTAYKNSNGHYCKYPKAISEIYSTGETTKDKEIAKEIHKLLLNLKGVNYLQKLNLPTFLVTEDEKKQYLVQRFNSAPALASFEIKSSLRSSHVALYEYLYGTEAACNQFKIHTAKAKSGNILRTLNNCKAILPKKKFPNDWLSNENHWILNETNYKKACENEISIYEQIGKLCLQLSEKRELSKAKTLIEKTNQFGKILAFDSTVLTLDYLKHLLEIEKTDAEIIVATGQNERNKKFVRENFAIANKETDKKLIALCSDAMAEGINLPSAKALMLLDMPSVLRIIEQRIGRLERMDSEHKEIHVFWPDDSEEFSLNGDKRIVETLLLTERLIGGNVGIPTQIFEKHYKNGMTVENIIKAYEEYSTEELDWQGVKDSTQHLYSLIEGDDALIDKHIYTEFKDVDATVKSAISFIETDKSWSFFAFRGDSTRSPKWFFIDENNKALTDFSEITEKLKMYLDKKKIEQRKWNEVDTGEEIKKIMRKLRLQEKNLLPEKKKRTLAIAEKILRALFDKGTVNNESRKELIRNIITLFNPESNDDSIIDYDKFAEMWLTIFQPALDSKRNSQIRKRKVITLRDLTYKDVKLDEKTLQHIYDSCQVATPLDEMIASCIIAIKRE